MESKIVNRKTSFMILGIVFLNQVVHFVHLPLWISASVGLIALWRLGYEFQYWGLPPRILRYLLYLLAPCLVFLYFKTIFGQDAGIALLVLASGLKLLEVNSYRDLMAVCIICFLLLMGKVLSEQSIYITLFVLVDVVLITSLLFRLHQREVVNFSIRRSVMPVARTLAFASPIIILLFFIFPRFNSRFIPDPIGQSGGIGFSDEMNPGSIGNLVTDNAIAFRARFPDGNPPPMGDLYWRGGVYSKSLGMKWQVSKAREQLKVSGGQKARRIRQEVILEPSFRKWLFGLDIPGILRFRDYRIHRQVMRREGFAFELGKDLHRRAIYSVESYYLPRYEKLSKNERSRNLNVSTEIREATNRLVKELLSDVKGDLERYPRRVMNYFKREGFRYTLQPGALALGTVSEFLFQKKKGFCEHFASSFATLMRLGGVPARVVAGFHGGVYNQFDGYYTVRNKDAHAWTEVWSDRKRRWIRYDPTSVVAPSRLSLGGQAFHDLGIENLPPDSDIDQISSQANRGFWWFAKSVRLAFDAMSNRWNLFLLNYDYNYQLNLLKSLGLHNVTRAVLLLFVIGVVVAIIISYSLFRRRQRQGRDRLAEVYERFCKVFVRYNLPRAGSEGPFDYLKRLSDRFPALSLQLRYFIDEYVALRYGGRELRRRDIVKLDRQVRAIVQNIDRRV